MSWLGDIGKSIFDNTIYNTEKSPLSGENLLNIGFLGASVVAGVFTGGLGTGLMFTARAALKGGVMAAVRGSAKTIGKTMIVNGAEATAKRTAGESVEYLSKSQVRRIAEESGLKSRGWFGATDAATATARAQRDIHKLNHNLADWEIDRISDGVANALAKGTVVGRNRAKFTAGVLATNFTRNAFSDDSDAVVTPRVNPENGVVTANPASAPTIDTGFGSLGGIFDKAVNAVDEMGGDFIGPDGAKLLVGGLMALSSMFIGGQIGGWKGLMAMGAILAVTYNAATGSKTGMNWNNVGLGDFERFADKYSGGTSPAAVLGR